jgi:hypothetical protein
MSATSKKVLAALAKKGLQAGQLIFKTWSVKNAISTLASVINKKRGDFE